MNDMTALECQGEVEINTIVVGERVRKDMGDIGGLAESIEELGLLQPIVLTPALKLIAGMRRIEAFLKLGRDKIPAHIVDIDKVVLGEAAENVVRKDFTISERVAIGKLIEEALGDRQGRRTDQLVDPGPQVTKGAKTRDVAGKEAHFKSGKQYHRAKKVVDRGSPALVEAMDKGEIDITNAAKVAELPSEQQREEVERRATPKNPNRNGGRVTGTGRSAIVELFGDGKWHKLETIATRLGKPEEKVEGILTRMGWPAEQVSARIEKKRMGAASHGDLHSQYRIFPSKREDVSMIEIREKLLPLILKLKEQGKLSDAAIAPAIVLRLASEAENLIKSWSK